MDVYYIVGQKSIDAHVTEVRSNLEAEYADVVYGTKQNPDGVRHILTAKDSSYSKNDISVFFYRYTNYPGCGFWPLVIASCQSSFAVICGYGAVRQC